MPSDNAELIANARWLLKGAETDLESRAWQALAHAHIIAFVDALSLADRRIEELTEKCKAMEAVVAAARVRGAYWHNDTCASVLVEDAPYACSCGKDALIAALATLDRLPATKEDKG